MDLLHHKMLKTRFLRSFRIPLDLHQIFLDLITVQIIERHTAFLQTAHLHISDIINISCILQNSRNIRCNKRFSVRHTDDHRTVLSRRIDLFRIIPEHNRQCIRAADPHHRMIDRIHWCVLILLIIIVNQLDRNFRIRVRIKAVTFVLQFLPKFLIIFNNTIMNTDHISIITAVRMCVQLTRLPVCRPACMPDSACSMQRHSVIRLLRENTQATFRLYDLHLFFAVTHCKSRRIIPAILQLCESIQQHRCRLSMSSKSNNSTHIYSSIIFINSVSFLYTNRDPILKNPVPASFLLSVYSIQIQRIQQRTSSDQIPSQSQPPQRCTLTLHTVPRE